MNLIINGNGITLNGQNACQFIKIGTDARLTLNNIVITNYTAEMYGGAICNKGELSITGSTLSGNTSQKDGGAIFNNGELTITGSALSGNTAEVHGGVIFNGVGGELTASDSTFTENTAQKKGGAIYLEKSILKNVSTKYESQNCIFKDNGPDDVYE